MKTEGNFHCRKVPFCSARLVTISKSAVEDSSLTTTMAKRPMTHTRIEVMEKVGWPFLVDAVSAECCGPTQPCVCINHFRTLPIPTKLMIVVIFDGDTF